MCVLYTHMEIRISTKPYNTLAVIWQTKLLYLLISFLHCTRIRIIEIILHKITFYFCVYVLPATTNYEIII